MANWDNIHELWEDVEDFARTYPNYTVMAADSPGIGFGWVAIQEGCGHEYLTNEKWWAITISAMKNTLPTRYDAKARVFQQHMKTAAGRRVICKQLNESPEGPLPKTRWERLMDSP